MKEKAMNKIEFVENKDIIVSFVNSNEVPFHKQKLSVFKYEKTGENSIRFFELCEYKYKNENAIYPCLVWEEVEVADHKKSLFVLTCDAMAGLD